jgi:hypothetical protein
VGLRETPRRISVLCFAKTIKDFDYLTNLNALARMMDYEMQKNHLGVSGDPSVDHDLVWRNALGLDRAKE